MSSKHKVMTAKVGGRSSHETRHSEQVEPAATPMESEIAALAYSYWEARAFQDGSAEEDWLRAEKELMESMSK